MTQLKISMPKYKTAIVPIINKDMRTALRSFSFSSYVNTKSLDNICVIIKPKRHKAIDKMKINPINTGICEITLIPNEANAIKAETLEIFDHLK